LSQELRARLLGEVRKVVIGRDREAGLLLVCLLAKGNALLEGVPGTSKTLLAKVFSQCLGLQFRRVQFTPDMLPLDIVGGFIFNTSDRQFEFKPGPIFTNILLADEINRTSPKVQSALLESMQERQVTVEGHTEKLPFPFMVIATQNPLEFEGVYPLPEGQLDRFMAKISFGYPDLEIESGILRRNLSEMDPQQVSRVLSLEELKGLYSRVEAVAVSDEVLAYATKIARETRKDNRIALGASPRAMVQLVHCARANAILNGRNYVTPDDIKELSSHVLIHRFVLNRAALLKGTDATPDLVMSQILDRVTPPR
jgi:MoxR-like ATPase